MPSRLFQALHLIFQFKLLALQAPNFDIIASRAGYFLIDPLFERPVLLRQFRKMSSNSHQYLLQRFQTT